MSIAGAGLGGAVNRDFVALHARGRPDHPALISADDGRRFSYAEVDRLAAQAAAVLVLKGLGAGDRLAAVARNAPELVILHLACARAGMIFVPLNWRLSPAELEVILQDCAPALIVGDDLLDQLVGSWTDRKCPLADIWSEVEGAAPLPPTPFDPDVPSLMLYTSGTSGAPKGVPLTERNLLATAVNFSVLGQVTPTSVFLVDSPMFHVIGMVTNIRPAFLMGGTVVVSSGFDPAVTLDRLADEELRVTHYFCVPQMADMIRGCPAFLPERLRGLTAIFTGGAPHPAASIRRWLEDGITIVDGYGMTEAGTVLGMPLNPLVIAEKAGSAGLLPPTIERRIVGDRGEACAPGDVGELLLRGPNITPGYWRRPKENEEAFTADGFFRTGDLVREDEDGFVFLVGRRKDMFISGGENVYPAEVEAVLKAHPDVADACVIGIPDERWGEVGHAAIVLHEGAVLDRTALLAHCEQSLARYKLPKAFSAVTDFPRTGSGKVIKADLRALLQPGDVAAIP